MYEEYFGLIKKPFQLTPDPEVFFASTGHQKALSYLQYGLTQSEGFIVITGGVGTGKTTIANHLISKLEEENIVARQLVTPNLSPDDLIISITKLFRLHPEGDTKAAHIAELTDYMRRLSALGRRMLLIIDEAQNLPAESIEELRMLSNIQVDGKSIIQSFLLGQTELEGVLSAPLMEQFRQRVIASASLTPLTEQELYNYINYRMTMAGWENEPLFSKDAVGLIHQFTGGIPRKINTFLDRVLLYTYMEELDDISEEVIRSVIGEVSNELNHQKQEGNSASNTMVPPTASRPEPEKYADKYQEIANRNAGVVDGAADSTLTVESAGEVSNSGDAQSSMPSTGAAETEVKTKSSPSADLNGLDADFNLDDLNGVLNASNFDSAKIESLLESLLTVNKRSLLVQGQMLKEMKIQNDLIKKQLEKK